MCDICTIPSTQNILLTVSPAVYIVDVQFADGQEREGPCDITITVGDATISFSPNTTPSDLEAMLNATDTINQLGGVRVEKREGLVEGGYLRAVFRIIFLTEAGVTHNEIPAISVASNENCSLNYDITARFVQSLTTPSFQVGFPDSPRRTRPLPVNTTTDEMEVVMEELLSYECTKTAPSNVSPPSLCPTPPSPPSPPSLPSSQPPPLLPSPSLPLSFSPSYTCVSLHMLGAHTQVLLSLEFEEETEDTSVVRNSAFCGRQSYVNPTVLWDGPNSFSTSIYTHVSACHHQHQ